MPFRNRREGMEYWFSVHETAKLAADVEATGTRFYERLQQVSGHRTVSQMCAFLAEQEQKHRANFLSISEAHRLSDREHCYSVDIRLMLQTSMRTLTESLHESGTDAPPPRSVPECISLAARVEATSVRVYSAMREQFTDRFADVLTDVLTDEERHLGMVHEVQRRLGLGSAGDGFAQPSR